MTTKDITTIAFPDAELLAKIDGRITDHRQNGVEFVVWSADNPTPEVRRDAVDAIILPYLNAGPTVERLGELGSLKLVQTQTTGYDPVAHLVGTEIEVATASGVHAAATAELALALTLARLRRVDVAARDMAEHRWNHGKHQSLTGRSVMILGAGSIGEEIRRRLVPFDCEIVRVASTKRVDEHGAIHGTDELPTLLPTVDTVIVITPLNDSTHGLVNAEFLAALPDGALVVNVARGKVIDTEALVAELSSGRLQAALDVVDPEPLPGDHPLWETPNTLITPHVGGNTDAFDPRVEQLLTEQIERIIAGEPLANIVSVL